MAAHTWARTNPNPCVAEIEKNGGRSWKPKRIPAMVKQMELIGVDGGLQFHISLDDHFSLDEREKKEKGLAWGRVSVFLKNEPVWIGEDADGLDVPLTWTWIDLLEHLGKWWPWLISEETYPISVSPTFPALFRREAERRWETLTNEEEIEREDEAVYRFYCRHDLAMGIKGLFLPSILLMRQGERFLVSAGTLKETLSLPFDDVVETLEKVGDRIAETASGGKNARGLLAVELWATREDRTRELAVQLYSGLSEENIAQMQSGEPPENYWEWDPTQPRKDTALLAATRMSGGVLSIEQQRYVLDLVRNEPKRKTPSLDGLATLLSEKFLEKGKPFTQGYWVAGWLRSELGLGHDENFDPERQLRQWGVNIEEIQLDNCPQLDAIAIWGDKHGPMILLNVTQGSRSSHVHGRRSTLAHEIGHLLIDRVGAMPVAEVLGGNAPAYPERRAGAFAAELLLTREAAQNAMSSENLLTQIVRELSERHEVSEEPVAWQIYNSSARANMAQDDLVVLNRLTRNVAPLFHNLS